MKTLLIFSAACIMLFSCTKNSTKHYQASGTIMGFDLSNCMCCSGYVLKMNGNDSFYRFYHLPAGSIIDSTHFPINVSFNYTRLAGPCGDVGHVLVLTSVVPNL
jgi:hypothetical protein